MPAVPNGISVITAGWGDFMLCLGERTVLARAASKSNVGHWFAGAFPV